jgi:Ti-type conjugative transfer relaxase TraA
LLSIGKASGGYYANLSKDDYYHSGYEPKGIWFGSGAKFLGLEGEADKEKFLEICSGILDGEKLVQSAGKENHREGWDFCFSVPKSVSVLWSQVDTELREKIEKANLEAVKSALSELEEKAVTRRGKNGEILEKAKLVISIFEHGTSRELDPQLHSHAVILNIGVRTDGTTGTLETKPLYDAKMVTGSFYRLELARNLKNLGFEIEKTKIGFEVKGVSKELCNEFSKRRQAIEKALKESKFIDSKVSQKIALQTRATKKNVRREELFSVWQKIGNEKGFRLKEVLGKNVSKPKENILDFLETGLKNLTQNNAYFTKDLLQKEVSNLSVGNFSISEVKEATEKYLKKEAIFLGKKNGQNLFTTSEIDKLEKKLIADILELKDKNFSSGFSEVILKEKLNYEQKKALLYLAEGKKLNVVSGMAGTGKTRLLRTAKSVWENQGLEVFGCSLSGKASKGLEEEAKIKSETIHKTLYLLERGEFKLKENSVLVVDEAGMVGTRLFAKLVEAVKDVGAKLVLVGDDLQLQPIEHGNPFRAISNRVGNVELTEIVRQNDTWARKAVKSFAFGQSEEGLKSYQEKGLLSFSDTKKDAVKSIVNDWNRERGALKDSIILGATKAEVSEINRLCQAERLNKNELKITSVNIEGIKIFENDRILFTKNSKAFNVKNGDLGTITEISRLDRTIKVKLDNEKSVTIPFQRYKDIQLGYAVTTHKAQGVTVNKAYVLVGGSMQDRELSYVQMSRGREQTRIYATKDETSESRNFIDLLSSKMNRSRQKEIAQDVVKNDVEVSLSR